MTKQPVTIAPTRGAFARHDSDPPERGDDGGVVTQPSTINDVVAFCQHRSRSLGRRRRGF